MNDDELQLQLLLLRAVAVTASPVTLVDTAQPDQPLIWVNDAFLSVTGYTRAEVIGRNCRFLQGPDIDLDSVALLRDAVRGRRAVTVTLANYRKDGSDFWNRLHVSPVADPGGGPPTTFVGVQTDVTAQVAAEDSLSEAEGAGRLARSDAAAARQDADRARSQMRMVTDIRRQDRLEPRPGPHPR